MNHIGKDNKEESVKFLGIYIDKHLTWKSFINALLYLNLKSFNLQCTRMGQWKYSKKVTNFTIMRCMNN